MNSTVVKMFIKFRENTDRWCLAMQNFSIAVKAIVKKKSEKA